MPKIFAIGRGQYENIGDIMLRRPLLDWVRPLGELHVYVGNSPAGYDEGLGLAGDDVVYRSLRRWYAAAMRAALAGGATYIFKPGEIQLTLIGMKEHLSMLPLLAALRLRGGKAIRVGVGARNYARLPRALMTPSIALSDYTRWRDVTTARYLPGGAPMPDLAFGEGAPDDLLTTFAERGDRNLLVVSMRSEEPIRPYPTKAWLDGVRAYAAAEKLQIMAVTQVKIDDERSRRLAADLGGQVLSWSELGGHAEQERRLREVYRRTAMVLSDRLHVVIAAFTEGAVPVGSLVDKSDKIDRHFAAIGIDAVTMQTRDLDAAGVVKELTALDARRPELFRQLSDARGALREIRADVERVTRREPLADWAGVQ